MTIRSSFRHLLMMPDKTSVKIFRSLHQNLMLMQKQLVSFKIEWYTLLITLSQVDLRYIMISTFSLYTTLLRLRSVPLSSRLRKLRLIFIESTLELITIVFLSWMKLISHELMITMFTFQSLIRTRISMQIFVRSRYFLLQTNNFYS